MPRSKAIETFHHPECRTTTKRLSTENFKSQLNVEKMVPIAISLSRSLIIAIKRL